MFCKPRPSSVAVSAIVNMSIQLIHSSYLYLSNTQFHLFFLKLQILIYLMLNY